MSQITSFKTREVRWFINRPIPELSRWFETLPPTSCTLESREDLYLVLPGRSDLGVKFRENRLELKYKLGKSRQGELVPGIIGVFEIWEKLGFPLTPEISNSVVPEGTEASRVPVLKRRLATMIETNGIQESFHPLGTPVAASVQLEYTKLQLLGSSWYTIGLEWLEDGDVTLPAKLLSDLLASSELEVNASMGYPEFLQGVLHLMDDF